VWLGFDKPKTIQAGAVGGTFAAPIWGQMMARYYTGRNAGDWPAPPGDMVFVEIDRETGQPATPFTPAEQRAFEFFIPGTEPGVLRGNPWNVARWGAW
jgi:penicillin-binding protein 1A